MKRANDIVKLAREATRPTSREMIETMVDHFFECHGDRYYGDDAAVVGGVGFLKGMPVTIIGIQKGKTLEENIETKFGSPSPEGYRKALRLMKQAEKFNRPVITLINTPGAYCGIEAEERGEGEAIARNLYEMSRLTVPTLSIFTGEGGSGGALALAVTDRVWMLEHSIYSILSPEGFASILWKDSSRAEEAAEVMKLTPTDLYELGIIEKIIPETKGNKPLPWSIILENMAQESYDTLCQLKQMPADKLTDQRYQRFRAF